MLSARITSNKYVVWLTVRWSLSLHDHTIAGQEYCWYYQLKTTGRYEMSQERWNKKLMKSTMVKTFIILVPITSLNFTFNADRVVSDFTSQSSIPLLIKEKYLKSFSLSLSHSASCIQWTSSPRLIFRLVRSSKRREKPIMNVPRMATHSFSNNGDRDSRGVIFATLHCIETQPEKRELRGEELAGTHGHGKTFRELSIPFWKTCTGPVEG